MGLSFGKYVKKFYNTANLACSGIFFVNSGVLHTILNIRHFILLLLLLFLLLDLRDKLKVFWCLFDMFNQRLPRIRAYLWDLKIKWVPRALTRVNTVFVLRTSIKVTSSKICLLFVSFFQCNSALLLVILVEL